MKSPTATVLLRNQIRFQQEAMMCIHMLMESGKKSRSDLADLLGGKHKRPLVTKFLSGDHNFRIDTLAEICALLDGALHLRVTPDITRFELPRDERSAGAPEGFAACTEITDVIARFADEVSPEHGRAEHGKAEATGTEDVFITRNDFAA
ncbi:MAG: hypothetical protein KJZ69_09795 [Phycisphaerales bacterium]|nr:hypothetical protein [Phycisphaerales bacterium]